MSFFLLGKGPDDELWLLSPKPVASRQDAMAELSRLTADPDFEHWDAEVLVMELDKGTPVLLVRPAAAAEPVAEEPAELAADEPEAVEETTDDVETVEAPTADGDATETEQTSADVAEDDMAAAIDAERLSDEEPLEVDAEVIETPTEEDAALAAVIEDLHADDEPVESESATEAESPAEFTDSAAVVEADEAPVVEPVDGVWAEAVAADAETDGSFSLKDALKRTAAHMESEGIVAPESVGPADETASVALADDSPVADEAAADESVAAAATAAPSSDEPVAAWPWDTGAADASFTIDAIEEPAREATPLVTAAGDDETFAVSRPVILGSYGEAQVAEPVLPEPAADAIVDIPADVPLADPGAPLERSAPDTSDFILDLEPIEPVEQPGLEPPAPVQAPEVFDVPVAPDVAPPVDFPADPAVSSAPDMTCEDCVYVRTCPNKDQRDPKTCGSFQWK